MIFLLSCLLTCGRINKTIPAPTNNAESQVADTYKSLGKGWVCTFSRGLPALRQLPPAKISASNA